MSKNRLANQMKVETSMKLTENGQLAYGDTGSALLNMFAEGGAVRSRLQDVADLFSSAYAEDKLLALKMAFYMRDIRGKFSGLGERAFMREVLKWMAVNDADVLKKNLHLVPFYGRWDDLYALVGTPLEKDAFDLMWAQWGADIENAKAEKPISLMAKWLKSTNTSSADSRKLGRLTAKHLGMTVPVYRKALSVLRGYLPVTEVLMSRNAWGEIDFEAVPSKCHTNNRKAFGRHEQERYEEYLNRVEKGEAVIKSATLYPYDIFEAMGFNFSGYGGGNFGFDSPDKTLELQWKALPDYVGEGSNILVMADTSGSMQGRPICTSVGLAVYFAERNTGMWKDTFLTFSSFPSLVILKGNTLAEKVKCVLSIVENTDLAKAFDLVLSSAVSAGISKEEMPRAIVVISDMEIDDCRGAETFHKTYVKKFAQAGYELPYVVYWQVDSRQNVFHATSEYAGVMLASGQSPSVFASIIANIGKSPMEAMLNVLNDERYAPVTI